jgi:hypothetical protein
VAYLGPGASEQAEERFSKVKPTFDGTEPVSQISMPQENSSKPAKSQDDVRLD